MNFKNNKEMISVNKTKKIFISFLLGSAIGSAIAYLYAPKSGKHLKDNIRRKTNDFNDEGITRTDNLWNNSKESTRCAPNSANDFLNTNKEKLMNKAEMAKDVFKAEVSAYNELRKSGRFENVSSMSECENTNNQMK